MLTSGMKGAKQLYPWITNNDCFEGAEPSLRMNHS